MVAWRRREKMTKCGYDVAFFKKVVGVEPKHVMIHQGSSFNAKG
jgi:hypothetical protein